jgi:hypothetical protein
MSVLFFGALRGDVVNNPLSDDDMRKVKKSIQNDEALAMVKRMAGKSEKIIRLKHESDFTIIGNSALRDKSLSWAARGLLVYMLSLPSDWNVHENELLAHTTDKKLATHSAMEELIHAGYVFKCQGKDFRNETYFFVSDSKTTKSLVENQSIRQLCPTFLR